MRMIPRSFSAGIHSPCAQAPIRLPRLEEALSTVESRDRKNRTDERRFEAASSCKSKDIRDSLEQQLLDERTSNYGKRL